MPATYVSLNKFQTVIRSLVLIALVLVPQFAMALSSSGITYQGRILKPNDQPLAGVQTKFRMQIRTTGSDNCVMYQEEQEQDLSASDGNFSLTLNDGNGTRQDTPTYDIEQIFANKGTFTFNVASCPTADVTYSPGPDDHRVLVVEFKDETMGAWEPMPPQTINYVPMALQAKNIAGFGIGNLVRVQEADGSFLSNVTPLSNANYDALKLLVAGTSGLYEKPGKLGGITVPSMGAVPGKVLGWDGSAWTVADPIAGVQAFAKTALPACAGGAYLRNNAGALECTTPAAGTTGTVTEIRTGTGLTGGPINDDGDIALAAIGSVGTGYKVSYDIYGRVTAAAAIDQADIPKLTTAGKVSGDAITDGKIAGTTEIDTTGLIKSTSGSFTSLGTQNIQVYKTNNAYSVSIIANPALNSNYTLTLPVDGGVSGQVLATNGTGGLSWQNAATGSVTSLTGDVTSTGSGAVATTIANSAVTFAKMQNVPTASIVGRYSSGSGAPESLTLGTGLALSAGGVLSSNITDTDTFAAVTAACGNGTVPLKAGGVWTCSTPTPLATSSAIVQRDGTGNFAANVITMNGAALNNSGSVVNLVNLAGSAYTLTMPVALGTSGQVLGTSGSGQLTWTTPAAPGTGDFKADGSVPMTGNLQLNGNYLSGDGGAEGVFVAADGKVGIGTTSPARELTVSGIIQVQDPAADATHNSKFWSDVNGFGRIGNVGGFGINVSGAEAMRIDSLGNVGIGTTGPLAKLEVAGSIRVADGGETCVAGINGAIRFSGGNLQYCVGTAWTTLGTAGAGLTALTGDVTASGSGSQVATIAANAIDSGKIADLSISTNDLANDAVTFGKIQNVPTASIAGRFTAGSGNLESLTLGTGLALSGAGVLSSNIVDTDTFAAVTTACGNGTVPLKAGGVWTCSTPTPLNTSSALVQRDGSGNFAAGVVTADGLALNNGGSIVNVVNPSGSAYTFTLPTDGGTSGYVLQTNGSGTTSWVNPTSSSAWATNAGNIYRASGNVGIGANTIPTDSLHINKTGSAAGITLEDDNAATALTFKSTANVGDGVRVGTVDFFGMESATSRHAARIQVKHVAHSAGRFPAEMVFSTGSNAGTFADTSSAPLRIQSGGMRSAAGAGWATSPVALGMTETVPTCYEGNCVGASVISNTTGGGSATLLDVMNISTTGTLVAVRSITSGTTATRLALTNSRNGSLVQSGDRLAQIEFSGGSYLPTSSTQTAQSAAMVASEVDGTPGASADMPGRLLFMTSADGSATPAERMRIDSLGNVGIGTTATAKLDVKGESRISGATSGYVGFAVPAIAGTTTYTWPSAPTNGYVLSTNGTGTLSWVAPVTGGITALTGDVTAAGSGSQAATIANDAVTFAKIQNIPTASLVGRYTASSGDAESITLGTGLALSGAGVLSSNIVDTDTFASTLGACANGTVPLRAGGVWTCGVPTPLSTNSAIVQRDVTGNFAANVITMNGAALNNAGSVVNLVNLAGSAYTLTMPVGLGTNGQVLSTSGSGQLTWATPASGSGDFKADGSVTMTGSLKTNGTVTAAGTSLVMEQTGDALGGSRLSLQNRNGMNGALFENTSLELVDFGFKVSSGAMKNLRYENRGGGTVTPLNAASGEFQLIQAPGSLTDAWFTSGPAATIVQNGKFGVGTTNPSFKMSIDSGASGNTLFGNGTLNGLNYFDFQNNSNTGGSTGVVSRLITYNVAGSALTSADFVKYKTGGFAINNNESDSSAFTAFAVGPAEHMRISRNGNVGIGTTSPQAALEVAKNPVADYTALPILARNPSNNTGTVTGIGFGQGTAALTDATMSGAIYTSVTNGSPFTTDMYFRVANSGATATPLVLKNSGDIGVGTSSPGAKLHLSQASATRLLVEATGTTAGPSIGLKSSGAGGHEYSLVSSQTSNGVTGSFQIFDQTASATRFLIDGTTGNIGIGLGVAAGEKLEVNGNVKATSFIATSDARLKKNVTKTPGLDFIKQLTGVTWQWKSNNLTDAGVIAQDVEKIMPYAVATDAKTGMKGVKYNALIAPLIESTKELYGMCEAHDRRIASLEVRAVKAETRVQELEKKNAAFEERLRRLEESLSHSK